MKGNKGCLVAGSTAFLFFTVFVYGLNPWFSPGVTTKKLAVQNPTTYDFDSSLGDVHAALRKKVVKCCGASIEFKDDGHFGRSILLSVGNENDAYSHNFHDAIGASAVYFSGVTPFLTSVSSKYTLFP
jgi:hypothetical protein